ncbi:azole resistance protein 1 [[Candida] anglica]
MSSDDTTIRALSNPVVVDKKVFIESDAGDGTKREDQYLHGANLTLCLLSLFLSLFLVALDQTIIITLLSDVGNKFNALDKVGWLASGFLLAMAVFVATWGKASVIFGRKIAMYVAIVLFEAGSLMCALSNSMNVLIGGRVLAGVGGGGIQSLVFIIITEIVPIEKRPSTMAFIGCVFAVASVLGPLIGGAFTSNVSWRWCFYINLPVGAVALVFLFFAFNPPKTQGNFTKKLKMIDYIGTFLLTSGCVIFLLALTFGASTYSWDSAAVICCFIFGVVMLIAFGVWNFKYSKSQILATEVIVIPQIVAATVTMFCMFAYFMASTLYSSVYFQVIWGADAWHSGLHLLPTIIPVVIASIAGGVTINKTRWVKPFSIAAGVLGPIGCGLLSILDVDSSRSARIGLLIVVGFSCGLHMQSCIISAQIPAPKTPGGTIMATTLINLGRGLGGAVGAALADAVYNSSFKNEYRANLKKLTDQSILEQLDKINISQLTTSSTILNTLTPDARLFVKKQIMAGIRNVFYMCLGFACLAFLAGLFMTNKRLPQASAGATAVAEETTPRNDSNKDDSEESSSTDGERRDFEQEKVTV